LVGYLVFDETPVNPFVWCAVGAHETPRAPNAPNHLLGGVFQSSSATDFRPGLKHERRRATLKNPCAYVWSRPSKPRPDLKFLDRLCLRIRSQQDQYRQRCNP
jgi:hypothetical protein